MPDFSSNPGFINEKHKWHLLSATCHKRLCSSLLAPPAFCKKREGINKKYSSQLRLTDLGKSTRPQLVCLMSQVHNYSRLRERQISPRYAKCHQPLPQDGRGRTCAGGRGMQVGGKEEEEVGGRRLNFGCLCRRNCSVSWIHFLCAQGTSLKDGSTSPPQIHASGLPLHLKPGHLLAVDVFCR